MNEIIFYQLSIFQLKEFNSAVIQSIDSQDFFFPVVTIKSLPSQPDFVWRQTSS